MFLNDLKRIVLVAAIVAGTTLPHLAAAQSAAESDAATADDTERVVVLDEAAPAEAPPDTAPGPVAPTPPALQVQDSRLQTPGYASMPNWQANATYLARLQEVRSAWFDLEFDVNDFARDQRLGTLNPSQAQRSISVYPRLVARADDAFNRLSPPPQFARVHQLHVDAAAELHAAMDAAEWWLRSGNQAGLADAQDHFARFDRLIGQALVELR